MTQQTDSILEPDPVPMDDQPDPRRMRDRVKEAVERRDAAELAALWTQYH